MSLFENVFESTEKAWWVWEKKENAYRFIFLLSPAVFLVGVELSGEADADLRLALDGLQEDLPPSLKETI